MSASASSPTASTGESVAEGGASITASAGGAGQPSIGGGAPRYSKRHRRRGTSRPPYRRRRGTSQPQADKSAPYRGRKYRLESRRIPGLAWLSGYNACVSILGLDLGEKRIGVAIAEAPSFVAVPLTVLEAKPWKAFADHLRQLTQERAVEKL